MFFVGINCATSGCASINPQVRILRRNANPHEPGESVLLLKCWSRMVGGNDDYRNCGLMKIRTWNQVVCDVSDAHG